jgi:hypothetical protein
VNGLDAATLQEQLTDVDLAVLDDVERFRLLTSQHIEHLHFTAGRTPGAAVRACNRALSRLREAGLLATLARRIGGVRRGSAGLVWHLAPLGERLQSLRRGQPLRRRRVSEPSRHFVAHTLAVADLAVEINQAAHSRQFEVLRLETEPANWQPSLTSAGVATWLKPDLLVTTAANGYEQHWFLETDLDTEHLPVIRRQNQAYQTHRSSGRYQAEHGVYPVVLWVAPTERRAAAIRRAVGADADGQDPAVRACSRTQVVDLLCAALADN